MFAFIPTLKGLGFSAHIYKIAEHHKNEADYKILEKMARKVSLRFKIVEFDDDFGGLSMTINVLKRNTMIVKSLTPEYTLILLLAKGISIDKTLKLFSDTKIDY
ncbi:hypothetical protein [Nitrosopumilus ureiphilus]|uniref:hypothetical protein n=1 Tax=Nitrosopumilus ureiphilus TaxID=1470067 RepID=UPI0015CA8E44|nr:hypothetical protein [Nitrosopumilus ureiphilus]